MRTDKSFIILAALTVTSVATLPGRPLLVPAHSQDIQRRAISADVLLNNGKLAQGLNAKYATMTMQTSCQEGDHACLQGGFAQCVAGKFVSLGCSPPTVCFELPLLLKPGSVPTCTTPEDAAARIANTGVKGGVKGAGTESSAESNSTASLATSVNGTDAMANMSNGTVPETSSASDVTPTTKVSVDANATQTNSHPEECADDDFSNSTFANAILSSSDAENFTSAVTNTTSPFEVSSNVTSSNIPGAKFSNITLGSNSTTSENSPGLTAATGTNATEEDCLDE
ncbi:hypothetical protein DFH28DRAFT_248533 [Melampsora americana]|nr:hypothetical protein DFH28DRAFT_248533 [Melampsora americana]